MTIVHARVDERLIHGTSCNRLDEYGWRTKNHGGSK